MAISASSTGSSNKRGGYTFIEMVVAVGIIMVIVSIALGYGRDTSNRALLLRTEAQIVAIFNRTKSLSQNFQLIPVSGKVICSYGVHVDRTLNPGEFIIFQDLVPSSSTCTGSANHSYDTTDGDGDGWPDERLRGSINFFKMDMRNLQFGPPSDPASSPDINDVVFVPPNPDVWINDDISINSGSVVVQVIGATANQFEVRINKFAQINAQ